jgi:hypothetical protein
MGNAQFQNKLFWKARYGIFDIVESMSSDNRWKRQFWNTLGILRGVGCRLVAHLHSRRLQFQEGELALSTSAAQGRNPARLYDPLEPIPQ